jgi:hypothetical protein
MAVLTISPATHGLLSNGLGNDPAVSFEGDIDTGLLIQREAFCLFGDFVDAADLAGGRVFRGAWTGCTSKFVHCAFDGA